MTWVQTLYTPPNLLNNDFNSGFCGHKMKCDSVAAWVSPDLSVLLNTLIMLTIEIYMLFFFKNQTERPITAEWVVRSSSPGAESVYNDVVKESTVSQLFAILARPQWGKFAALSVWSKPFYSETHNYKVRCSSILVRRHWTACTETVLALHLGNTTCELSRQLLSCLFWQIAFFSPPHFGTRQRC